MSGPKGYSYEVVSPEELARRALTESQNRCDRLDLRLIAANRLLNQSGLVAKAVPTWQSTSIDEARDAERMLTAAVERAEKQLKELSYRQALQAMPAALTQDLSKDFESKFRDVPLPRPQAIQSATSERSTSHSTESQVEVKARIDIGKAMAKAALIDRESERLRLTALAERALSRLPRSVAAEIGELQMSVNAALREQENVALLRAQVEDELSNLDMSDPRVCDLRDRAESASEVILLDAVLQETRDLKLQKAQASDHEFVERTAAEVLAEMGYQVERISAGRIQGQSTLIAHRQDLPDHAMQVRLLGHHHLMLTRIVAKGDTTVEADVRAEHLTCADSGILADRMTDRGIGALRVHAQPVGAVPVEHRSGVSIEQEAPENERQKKPLRNRTVQPNHRSAT